MEKKKRTSFIPAIIFIVFIYVMTILFFVLPKKEFSPLEKKYLSEPVEFSFSSLFDGSFGEDFETYLTDHIPARQFYVGLNSYYTKSLGNNCINGIYSGFEGYLIAQPGGTEQFEKNVGVINNFANKVDIPVTVMVVPNTGYIMDDKLPPVHNKYTDKEQFKLMEETFSQNENIRFVNILEQFDTLADEGQQLYYKTDHHWTTNGTYHAYKTLGETLGYEPVELSSFVAEKHKGFYGTGYSKSGLWFTEPDTITIYEYKGEQDIDIVIEDGTERIESESLYFKDHLDELDMYPVFIDGNHPFTRITNNNVQNGKKLLVLKDSFAHSMAPFLAENYEEIVLLDIRYYKNDLTEFIKEENFSDVLFLYGLDTLSTDTNLVYLEALVKE